MRPNRTKRRLRAGEPAIGTFCVTASGHVAEALGVEGFDFVTIDLQHGENDLGNLSPMLQAVSITPATPLVRVAANMPVYIQRALDLGAYGVIVPLVNTPEDAAAVVTSVRYAPAGARSWGPVRGMLYGGTDYFAGAAEELLTVVMLETAQGVHNARAILDTPGIDACFIGPNDLAVSLGYPPQEPRPPVVEDAIASIRRAAEAAHKIAGIHVFAPRDVEQRLAEGFRFIALSHDMRMLRAGAAEAAKAVKH
jgi:4-hydroxy-2-oxoheptanedioate aldolase